MQATPIGSPRSRAKKEEALGGLGPEMLTAETLMLGEGDLDHGHTPKLPPHQQEIWCYWGINKQHWDLNSGFFGALFLGGPCGIGGRLP